MSDKVKPCILDLFAAHSKNLDEEIHEPHYFQLYKVSGHNGRYKLSDGQYFISTVVQDLIDQSFAVENQVVKLNSFYLGSYENNGKDPKVYFRVSSWSDEGPGEPITAQIPPIKYDLVFKKLYPGDDQKPDINATVVSSTAQIKRDPKEPAKLPETFKGLNLIRIEGITAWIPSNWVILARVSMKSDKREFRSKNGDTPGTLFNLTLTDETSDIRCVGFTEACDKFYDLLVEGQQYYFAGLICKQADKRFNTTNHDFELTFTRNTKVEPAVDTDRKLPEVFFKFVPSIADLANCKLDSNVDVAGVVYHVSDLQELTSKSNSVKYNKREISIVDESNKTVGVALWGADAEQFVGDVGTVVALKSAKLSSFNTRSLSVTRAGKLVVDLDDIKIHKLKGWWEANNGQLPSTASALSEGLEEEKSSQSPTINRATVATIIDDRPNIGQDKPPQYYNLKARIGNVFQRNIAYPACISPNCQKKVVSDGDHFKCEKCNITIPTPKYRYILSMQLYDGTRINDGLQVSAFHDVGVALFGDRAAEFQHMRDEAQTHNPTLQEWLKENSGCEYIWNIRATPDVYNDEARVRYQITSVKEVRPLVDGSKILDECGL